MDLKGRNQNKEEIPGSGRSMHGYFLTYSSPAETGKAEFLQNSPLVSEGEHYDRKRLRAVGSQQSGPEFLRSGYPPRDFNAV